jgi:hypothetical protein
MHAGTYCKADWIKPPVNSGSSTARGGFGAEKRWGWWLGGMAAVVLFAGVATGQDVATASLAGKGAGPRVGKISVVEIHGASRVAINALAQAGFDVASVKADRVLLYADSEELAGLRAAGWTWKVVEPKPALPTGAGKELGAYNNFAAMTAMLDAYAANYPAICRKYSLGKSVQNRDLWALKITTNPDVESDKPEFRYVATVHGNEALGTEMSLYFIDLLCKGWATNNTRISNLVHNVEIWVLPMNNPDGREYSSPRRYNANGYDLNRNYPEGSGNNFGNVLYGPGMATNGVQPETRHLMMWTAAHNFTMGVHYHTGALVVNYPYDNDSLGSVFSPSPDEALFAAMSRTYSSNNPPMWASPYFNDGIVNGAEWYAVSGGVQDWSYRYHGSMEATIEISDDQWPDPAAGQLPTYWSQNREAMLAYLEWCLRGVRGVMRDAVTGAPVRGAVRVEGIHRLVFSDGDVGDYHRVLLPGTYHLWFYAPGYQPQRVTNIVVGSSLATRVDVAMQPISPRFAAKVNFQPAAATLPLGFVADSGALFGAHGGYSFGWETTLSSGHSVRRNAARSGDLRYDTHTQMQAGGSHVWEIAVPNGAYSVLVAAGDPNYATGTYRILAENVPVVNGSPTSDRRWVEGLATVIVTDGRLTLTSGAGAVSNRLAFVEINAVEPTTLAQWRAQYFGSTNNAGSAANTADPDQDGLTNLLEYAFGFVPTNPETGWHPSGSVLELSGTNWPALTFFRNPNATDMTFTVQGADQVPADLWRTLAAMTNGAGWFGPAAVAETPDSGTRAMVTVQDSQPLQPGTNRFLRVQVSQP